MGETEPAPGHDDPPQVLSLPDQVSADQCALLIDAFRSAVAQPALNGITRILASRTELPCSAFLEIGREDVHALIGAIRDRSVSRVEQLYRPPEPLYVEFTLMSEMRTGDCHRRHADNERQTAPGVWAPNHTWWRSHTSIYYLNTSGDDFDGGVLRFGSGQEVVPSRGLGVTFPCDHFYEHEATAITRGCRYSIAIWMTHDISHAEWWS